MPHRTVRTRFLPFAAVLAFAVSCGGGAGTGDLDKIQVTMTQFEVSITNTSGKALMEVVAEIEPAGPASHFTARVARLENGEKRSIAHTSFTDRDYVPFSARNTRAKQVIVTAKDLDNKAYRVEVPFKK